MPLSQQAMPALLIAQVADQQSPHLFAGLCRAEQADARCAEWQSQASTFTVDCKARECVCTGGAECNHCAASPAELLGRTSLHPHRTHTGSVQLHTTHGLAAGMPAASGWTPPISPGPPAFACHGCPSRQQPDVPETTFPPLFDSPGMLRKHLESASLALQLLPSPVQEHSNLLAVKGGPAPLSLDVVCGLDMQGQDGLAAGIGQLPCPFVNVSAHIAES